MKKKTLVLGLMAGFAGALSIGLSISLLTKNVNLSMKATGSGDWVHYAAGEATENQLATKEYWVECGGTYQFEAPTTGSIREGGSPDVSEFTKNDDRWDRTQRLVPYSFNRRDASTFCGASMYNITDDADATWRMTGTGADRLDQNGFWSETAMNFNFYLGKLFKWELPKINFTEYTHVYTYVQIHNWSGGNLYIGFAENDVIYHNVPGVSTNSAPQALLEFTSSGSVVYCSLKIDGYNKIESSFGADAYMLGRESLCLYAQAEGSGDGHFSMANLTCEAENYINYGSLTQIGRYNNAIQPILSTGGNHGSLENLPNGNYYITSVDTIKRTHDDVTSPAVVTGNSDLLSYNGTQMTFNDWWLRRLFGLQGEGSFWSDGDVIILNGDFVHTDGFIIHISTSCIRLAVADGALTGVSLVKA